MGRIALIEDLRVEIAGALISHLVPVTTDGGLDLAAWKQGQFGISRVLFYLTPSAAGAIVISAGAHVVGSLEGVLYRVATLNKAAAINLTATLGYAEVVQDIGDYEKLWLVDVGSGSTHKYGAIPLEERA